MGISILRNEFFCRLTAVILIFFLNHHGVALRIHHLTLQYNYKHHRGQSSLFQCSYTTSSAHLEENFRHCVFLNELNWGVLSLRGNDRSKFLQSLSTNSLEELGTGDAIGNAFVNSQGKLVAHVRNLVCKDDIKILCDPSSTKQVQAHLEKLIFPLDDVRVVDESSMSSVTFLVDALTILGQDSVASDTLIGSGFSSEKSDGDASEAPAMFSATDSRGICKGSLLASGAVSTDTVTDTDNPPHSRACCWVIPGATIAPEGYTILQQGHKDEGAARQPAAVAQAVLAWERERQEEPSSRPLCLIYPPQLEDKSIAEVRRAIQKSVGYPAFTAEVAANCTALEAGLMHTLHFRKGCFVGQEAVSKTVTANAVRRKLCALSLPSSSSSMEGQSEESLVVPSGSRIVDEDGDVIGGVTSGNEPKHSLPVLKGTIFQLSDQGVIETIVPSTKANLDDDSPQPSGPTVPQSLYTVLQRVVSGTCLALLKASVASTPGAMVRIVTPVAAPIPPTGSHSGSSVDRFLDEPVVLMRVEPGLAYPTYGKSYSPAPPVEKVRPARSQGGISEAEAAAAAAATAAEAKRKADKLAAMAERVKLLQQRKTTDGTERPSR